MASHIRVRNPASLTDPTPYAYSHAVSVEPGCQYVHLAGEVGSEKGGKISSDFSTQSRQAFANIKSCLAEAGGTLRDIVSMTMYVVDYDAASMPIFDLCREQLADDKGVWNPPAALIPVAALAVPDLKIEIQCTAAIRPKVPTTHSTILRHDRTIQEVDVVVVGAGLSGMQAATDVQSAGFSCVVLEAKDRVGGKTQSIKVDHGSGMVDLGAAWINDRTHHKMYALLQKFGLEPIIQRVKGDEVFRMGANEASFRTAWPGLPAVDATQQAMFLQITQDMDADSKSINLHDSTANMHIEDISLGEYFRRKGATKFALSFWTAWIHDLTGADPDDIGLVYWLDYVKSAGGMESLLSDGPEGAQYMTNRGGNQTVSIRLAGNLKPGSVCLNCPVNSVAQTSNGTIVETLSGEVFRARKVLISIPTPLYRHIKFSPPLPADKQEFVDSVYLGPYCKCILVYSSPWWREAGFNGSFIDLQGPVVFSRDVSSDEDGMYVISCLIGGGFAWDWMRLPVSRRVTAVKKQLADMVGPEHAEKVHNTIQTIEKHWAKEPYIEGVPCPMPAPGGIWPRLGNALRRPFDNLHFIGTETAFEWKGYMEGAVRAGERGAGEVIADLLAAEESRKGANL